MQIILLIRKLFFGVSFCKLFDYVSIYEIYFCVSICKSLFCISICKLLNCVYICKIFLFISVSKFTFCILNTNYYLVFQYTNYFFMFLYANLSICISICKLYCILVVFFSPVFSLEYFFYWPLISLEVTPTFFFRLLFHCSGVNSSHNKMCPLFRLFFAFHYFCFSPVSPSCQHGY